MSLWTPYDMEQAIDLSVKQPSFAMQPYPSPGCSPPSEAMCFKSAFHSYRFNPYLQCRQPSPPQQVPGEYSLTRSPPSSSPVVELPLKHLPRPFKAVTSTLPESKSILDTDPTYAAFREAMLEAMRARNGGSLTVTNPRMRRMVHRSSHTEEDMNYLDRRARNNAAAKRSRDIRRQKEDELAIRAAFLQRKITEMQNHLNTIAPACLVCRGRDSHP